MNDRELLELAARAYGARRELMDDGEPFFIGEATDHAWNPLDYDGDALRLAVKLHLDIQFFEGFGEIIVEHASGNHPQAQEEFCEDMQAATRRAIVRAAAEIGMAMP